MPARIRLDLQALTHLTRLNLLDVFVDDLHPADLLPSLDHVRILTLHLTSSFDPAWLPKRASRAFVRLDFLPQVQVLNLVTSHCLSPQIFLAHTSSVRRLLLDGPFQFYDREFVALCQRLIGLRAISLRHVSLKRQSSLAYPGIPLGLHTVQSLELVNVCPRGFTDLHLRLRQFRMHHDRPLVVGRVLEAVLADSFRSRLLEVVSFSSARLLLVPDHFSQRLTAREGAISARFLRFVGLQGDFNESWRRLLTHRALSAEPPALDHCGPDLSSLAGHCSAHGTARQSLFIERDRRYSCAQCFLQHADPHRWFAFARGVGFDDRFRTGPSSNQIRSGSGARRGWMTGQDMDLADLLHKTDAHQ